VCRIVQAYNRDFLEGNDDVQVNAHSSDSLMPLNRLNNALSNAPFSFNNRKSSSPRSIPGLMYQPQVEETGTWNGTLIKSGPRTVKFTMPSRQFSS